MQLVDGDWASVVALNLCSLPLLRLLSISLLQLFSDKVSVEALQVRVLYVLHAIDHFFNERSLLGLALNLPRNHLLGRLGLVLLKFLLRYPLVGSFLEFIAHSWEPQYCVNSLELFKVGIVRFSNPPDNHIFHFAFESQRLDHLVLLSFNSCS